jgi:hypothetical protein
MFQNLRKLLASDLGRDGRFMTNCCHIKWNKTLLVICAYQSELKISSILLSSLFWTINSKISFKL